MSDIRIKDIYAGRPDAKDEINFDGFDSFIKTFVVADHFNLDSLISGNHCFITGFKGTGKTALLFYLEKQLKVIISSGHKKMAHQGEWINCGTFTQWLSTSFDRDKLETQQEASSWTKETRCATVRLYDSTCIIKKKKTGKAKLKCSGMYT